jgi:hypothetical protein
MANDEISEAGRKKRFERWEKLGVDAVNRDSVFDQLNALSNDYVGEDAASRTRLRTIGA